MNGPAVAPAHRSALRRRVLFALPGLHRVQRGAEVAFQSIATELAAIPGYEVTLIGTGRADPARPYRFESVACVPRERFERFPSFPVLRSSYVYEELSYTPGLVRAYAPREYDVTCACTYPFTNWTLRALRFGRSAPPHVYVTQNGDWPAYACNREYRLFGCDGLVCTNPRYYERNRDRWRSTVIANGVDPTVFKPGVLSRARFGIPANAPTAVMVSALIPTKRVLEGIRCAARVPDLHLLVVGDGELRDQIDASGKERLGGRYRRVVVPHAEMPDVYRAADVFLHMTQDEPFGNVYLEALATGLPVIAHDNGASRWILEDQAILVDTSDESAVAGAIRRALESHSPAHTAARRALVERRYTWQAVARQYADFFEQLLRGPIDGANASTLRG